MAVFNDFAGNTHTQSGTLSDRFGGKKVLKQPLFHLVGHSLTVVAHGDNDVAVMGNNTDRDLGLIVFSSRLCLMPDCIEGIVHHIKNGTADILRD